VVTAQNQLKAATFAADQARIASQGTADAQVIKANGEAQAIELDGEVAQAGNYVRCRRSSALQTDMDELPLRIDGAGERCLRASQRTDGLREKHVARRLARIAAAFLSIRDPSRPSGRS
jgi:hypothetical protein